MSDKPWGSMDPNSANQVWVEWTWIVTSKKNLSLYAVTGRIRKIVRRVIGSVGQMKVDRVAFSNVVVWTIQVRAEGIPFEKKDEVDNRVVKGIRDLFFDAVISRSHRLLAGKNLDGPPAQLVVIPSITV